MLLVDHHKPEVTEPHRILDHGMRADENMERPVGKLAMYHISLFFRGGTGEKFYVYSNLCCQWSQCLKMLRGKNLRRRHQTGLCAIVKSNEHAQQCHKGFPASHIALQQTVHLTPAVHIGTYLLYHTFLRAR